MTTEDLLRELTIKDCKEKLDTISLRELNNDLREIMEDDYSEVVWIKCYHDYNTGIEYVIGFSSYEEEGEHYLQYKYGYIERFTMVMDSTDILMPYNEDTGEVYDTECTCNNQLTSEDFESIKNGFYDFINHCIDVKLIKDF